MEWQKIAGREELGNLACEAGYSCRIIQILPPPPPFPYFYVEV